MLRSKLIIFSLCAEVQVNHLPLCADLDISSADEDASHVSVHADVGIGHVIVPAVLLDDQVS